MCFRHKVKEAKTLFLQSRSMWPICCRPCLALMGFPGRALSVQCQAKACFSTQGLSSRPSPICAILRIPCVCILNKFNLFIIVQGGSFNWTPPKFSKYRIPWKLAQNFSKCQQLYRDFILRKFRGGPVKRTTLYVQVVAGGAWDLVLVSDCVFYLQSVAPLVSSLRQVHHDWSR